MAESDEQYDALGQTYERAKHIPTGLAEQATFLSALPDLAGKSVLDVACGTGFYPRVFADLGAAKVVGVDSSAEMVAYAKHVEGKQPRGIEYRQMDAADLPAVWQGFAKRGMGFGAVGPDSNSSTLTGITESFITP